MSLIYRLILEIVAPILGITHYTMSKVLFGHYVRHIRKPYGRHRKKFAFAGELNICVSSLAQHCVVHPLTAIIV